MTVLSLSGVKVTLLLGRTFGGGTEAHASWLCEALCDKGISAELYPLFPDHHAGGLKQELVEMLTLEIAYRRFIRHAEKQKPDIVICFGRMANCLGHRLKKDIPEAKLVASCRTNRRLPKAYRETLAAAHTVLVNSKWAEVRVRQLPAMREASVRLIPNALLRPGLFELEQSETAQARARDELGLQSAVPVLCMLANFVPGKNQEALIRMLAEGSLPTGAQVLLVGEGSRLGRCRRLAARLGVARAVHFPGWLEKIETIFQASDIMVSTSLRDSMPNALIQAQAAGLPVVAYDVAGVGEAIIPGKTGFLVQSCDTCAFAHSLGQLMNDPVKRAQFAEAARRQADARFCPKLILKDYLLHLDL